MALMTIAIPTYNRAPLLDYCLLQISRQMEGIIDKIELIVSDNYSSDETPAVVERYHREGMKLRYIRNSENVGADRNIAQCFKEASSRFVLIMGDDDFFLPGAIRKLLSVIEREPDAGIIHIKGAPYNDQFEITGRLHRSDDYYVYHNRRAFIHNINFWFTFISGNVFNKDLVKEKIDPYRFTNTNLVQLSWMLPLAVRAMYNITVREELIAVGKVENTGGYKIFEVFGANFNKVMTACIVDGFEQAYIDTINRYLLCRFFPGFVVASKKSRIKNLADNDAYKGLYGQFKGYWEFWTFLFPIFLLKPRFCGMGAVGAVLYGKWISLRSRIVFRVRLREGSIVRKAMMCSDND